MLKLLPLVKAIRVLDSLTLDGDDIEAMSITERVFKSKLYYRDRNVLDFTTQ